MKKLPQIQYYGIQDKNFQYQNSGKFTKFIKSNKPLQKYHSVLSFGCQSKFQNESLTMLNKNLNNQTISYAPRIYRTPNLPKLMTSKKQNEQSHELSHEQFQDLKQRFETKISSTPQSKRPKRDYNKKIQSAKLPSVGSVKQISVNSHSELFQKRQLITEIYKKKLPQFSRLHFSNQNLSNVDLSQSKLYSSRIQQKTDNNLLHVSNRSAKSTDNLLVQKQKQYNYGNILQYVYRQSELQKPIKTQPKQVEIYNLEDKRIQKFPPNKCVKSVKKSNKIRILMTMHGIHGQAKI